MIPELNKIVENISEALSIYINQIVYDKKSHGERVYTYSLGEAFFDVPRFEISDEDWRKGYHYSGSLGQPELRQKLAKMYQHNYQSPVNAETEVLVSAGSKPLLFMVFQTILSSGDEVLVADPAWLSYKEQIKLAGGIHVAVPYNKSIYEWAEYITPKTKAILINNPNNPSGQLYSREEMVYLVKLARKHNFFILSDEAYCDFLVNTDTFISFAQIDTSKENVIIINSLSKNMGMSGWRVGYAIAHEQVIKQILKLNQHLITCAPTVLQDYIAKHFDDILAYTRPQAVAMAEKRKKVCDILDKVGIKALKGVGTFYFLLNVSEYSGTTDELVEKLLMEHNIAVVPGIAYGESTKDFIRFGIGVESLEDIEKSLKIIKFLLTSSKVEIVNG